MLALLYEVCYNNEVVLKIEIEKIQSYILGVIFFVICICCRDGSGMEVIRHERGNSSRILPGKSDLQLW